MSGDLKSKLAYPAISVYRVYTLCTLRIYHRCIHLVNIERGFFIMPSDKPKIVIRTEQETIDKLDIIAKEQNRSRANLAEYILKDFISNYEKENGRINNSKLSVSKIS